MIRIGDFSKLSRVPVKTLRYYAEMGLLQPVVVDAFTGYRLYEYSQLSVLNRILALKDLGFSLDDDLSVKQMRGMLKLHQMEVRQRVQQEAERLERIETRLRQIEQEKCMSKNDVVIKSADEIKVAFVRGVVPTPPDQGSLQRPRPVDHGSLPGGVPAFQPERQTDPDTVTEIQFPVEKIAK
jgi:DNA-binding transcriptional MerR regulator